MIDREADVIGAADVGDAGLIEKTPANLKYGDEIAGWRYRDRRPLRDGKVGLLFSRGRGAEAEHRFVEDRPDLTMAQVEEELSREEN